MNRTLDDIEPEEWSAMHRASMHPNALERQVGGDHYKGLEIQPVEFIVKNNMGYCEANIIKYATRAHLKGGIEDIDKIIHYAELLKELKYGIPNR